MRHLQEKMQILELEDELHQCASESERATIDGCEVYDDAKDLELNKNSVAGFAARNDFIAPMVSQSNVRIFISHDYQTNGLNDLHNENRFVFRTLIVIAEELLRCSLFATSIVAKFTFL